MLLPRACVGYILGKSRKTQTDIATMYDLYLDGWSPPMHSLYTTFCLLTSPLALGIMDENDLMELKGTEGQED